MNCYDKLTKKQNPPLNVCQLNNVRHGSCNLLRFINQGMHNQEVPAMTLEASI